MALDLTQAAEVLGVAPATVRRWAHQGRLGVRRPSGEFRFERDELLRWADAQGLHAHLASGATVREPVHHDDEPDGGELSAALSRGGVLHDVHGATPAEALGNVVERALLPESEDRAALLAALLDRERLAPTAVGGGVALPHPRVPSPEFVTSPTLVIALLTRAVPWGAVDGRPVDALLVVLSPGPHEHLRLLALISHLLRRNEFAAALHTAAAADDVRGLIARLESEIPG